MIGAASFPQAADDAVRRQHTSPPAEPGTCFDAELASLDKAVMQGGLAGLPKPGSQAAATFGELGFFEAGPAFARIEGGELRTFDSPDDVDAEAVAVAGSAQRVPVLPSADEIAREADTEPSPTDMVGANALMAPSPKAEQSVRPPANAQMRQPLAACSLAVTSLFGDRFTETKPAATAPLVRARPSFPTGSTATSVMVAQRSVAGTMTVAVRGLAIDDQDLASLSDAVRGLLARHGLILGSLTINGQSAGNRHGQGSS